MRADLVVEAVQERIQMRRTNQRHDHQFHDTQVGEAVQVFGELARWRQRSFEIAAGLYPTFGETEVDAMGDREALEAAAPGPGDFLKPAQALREPIGVHARAVITVAQFDRAGGRAAAESAHPDWNRAR
jgi:hypothetical protein